MTVDPPDLRLWIVDDHVGFRENLAAVLRRRGFDCERLFGSARGLFAELAAGPLPDALLLDIRMPRIDGLETLKEIRVQFPSLIVLMLTASDDEDDLFGTLRAGANGYLLKTATPSELGSAIRRAVGGGRPLDPDMGSYLLDALPGASAGKSVELSAKEAEVLRHLADGEPAKSIAQLMGVSIHTVDSHLRNLYRKLDAPNQSAAVARAFRLGLLK